MKSERLYYKIAHMYYKLGYTQEEIANKLFLTRQKVNQIINSLIDLDIITITVNSEEDRCLAIELELSEKYGLNQVLVVDCFGENNEKICWKNTIVAATRYFESVLRPNSIIGVTWGTSVSAMVKNVSFMNKSGCTVVQLTGVHNINEPLVKADVIASLLASKLSCGGYMLYAPVAVDYPETKDLLLKESYITRVTEMIRQCDIAVVGIGEIGETSSLFKKNVFSPEVLNRLLEEGFCCDINLNFLKEDGSGEGNWLEDRIITASIEDLKRIPNTIGIVSGTCKVKAIIAALNSGCINTLIIDSETAQRVLEYSRKKGV